MAVQVAESWHRCPGLARATEGSGARQRPSRSRLTRSRCCRPGTWTTRGSTSRSHGAWTGTVPVSSGARIVSGATVLENYPHAGAGKSFITYLMPSAERRILAASGIQARG